jgi:peptidoglycan/LPS O-acetylase OafA/YrhL
VSGKDRYFPPLTGFRAIAALLVFANHYNPFAPQRFPFLNGIINELNIGVSMFFVLSGFLITIRYDDPLLPKPTFRQYMLNRFARIYPLYFILTTLTSFVIGEWGWVYIANITITKGFFDELKFTGIAQAWSLTVEETFYFLAPFLFLTISKFKPALFLWPCVLLAMGVLVFDSIDFMLVYTFFGRSFEFFIGIALAKLYQQKRPGINNKQQVTLIGIAILSICLVLLVVASEKISRLIIHQLIVPTGTALLLWGLLTENSWIMKFLSTKFMQLLGKSSYAFYLIHIGVIATLFSNSVSSNPIALFLMLTAVSIALYYAIELPAQRLLNVSLADQNTLSM